MQCQDTRDLKPRLPKWTMTLTSAAITHCSNPYPARAPLLCRATSSGARGAFPPVLGSWSHGNAGITVPALLKHDFLFPMDATEALKYNSPVAQRQRIPKCLLGQGADTELSIPTVISAEQGRAKKSLGLRSAQRKALCSLNINTDLLKVLFLGFFCVYFFSLKIL